MLCSMIFAGLYKNESVELILREISGLAGPYSGSCNADPMTAFIQPIGVPISYRVPLYLIGKYSLIYAASYEQSHLLTVVRLLICSSFHRVIERFSMIRHIFLQWLSEEGASFGCGFSTTLES